ncbi:MAG: peptidoglycan D,D-transpeptidase FtsI family protein [Chloroflexota bacterium]
MTANSYGGGPVRRPLGPNIARVGLALSVAFGALAAGAGYWQVARSAPLSAAPDNPAVVAATRKALRGRIVDRNGTILADNKRDANGEPYRVYRDPSMSQVIGYASRQFGTVGLERTYDAELVGSVRPDPVADLLKKFEPDPFDPQQLTLSISLPLQRAAVKALGNDRGAVIMLDPKTGEVLALASTPTYDASTITDPDTGADAFAKLLKDKRLPFLPRGTQGRYVPGSVFKIVTALAGLGSGSINPDTTYPQQPKSEKDGLVVSGFRIHDGHHLVTGAKALDFYEATEVSCNIWYALTGLETGGENLAATAKQLGFGDNPPFDLPLGASQVTNGGGNFGGGFKDSVELANASYGQAETVVTPFQMALVAAAVANDGVLMQPHIVTSLTGKKSGTRKIDASVWRRIVSGGVASDIQQAMQRAVEGPLGRQFTSGAKVSGVPTAGKSGTAELGGSGEPNSWFIGFAPVDDPQVAIAVVVEQGGRGGERAAPLAGDMMTLALKTLAGG